MDETRNRLPFLNTRENHMNSKLERNSIMESEVEFPFENVGRRSLMQTYDASKLPGSPAKRKASALEIYSAKHMEMIENKMKIIDDQQPAGTRMRNSLFRTAQEGIKYPAAATAQPMKRIAKRPTGFGLHVVPQNLTTRHGQALAIMAAKNVETELLDQGETQIVKNVCVVHGQDKSNRDLHPYIMEHREKQAEELGKEAVTRGAATEGP